MVDVFPKKAHLEIRVGINHDLGHSNHRYPAHKDCLIIYYVCLFIFYNNDSDAYS